MLLKIELANTWPFYFKNFKNLGIVNHLAVFAQKERLVPPSRPPQQPILTVSNILISHWLRAELTSGPQWSPANTTILWVAIL
jgi:hypothetical protein